MATKLKRFEDGIILKPTVLSTEQTIEGAVWVVTSGSLYTKLSGGVKEVLTHNQSQIVTNKTIDADSNTITNIDNLDIKAGANIDAAKIGTGLISNTEFNYLDGVTSAILGKDQVGAYTGKTIDADQNTITNIENTDIKIGAAIDATKISSGLVSNTEFDFLDGVTSAILGKDQGGAFTTKSINAANNTITNLSIPRTNFDTTNLATSANITGTNWTTKNTDSDLVTAGAVKLYIDNKTDARDTLAELTDVVITPLDKQVLVYNGGTSKWNSALIVDANIDTAAAIVSTKLADNATIVEAKSFFDNTDITGAEAERLTNNSDVSSGTQLHQHDTRYYTKTQLDAGQLDNRYFTETEIGATTGAGLVGITAVGSVGAGTVQTAIANLDGRAFSPISGPTSLSTSNATILSLVGTTSAVIIDYVLKNGTVIETGVITVSNDQVAPQLSVHTSSTGDTTSVFSVIYTGSLEVQAKVAVDNTASIKFSYRTLSI